MALSLSNLTRTFYCRQQNYLKSFSRTRASSSSSSTSIGTAGSTNGNESTVNIPSKEIVTPLPPLSEPLTDLPPVQYARTRTEQRRTQVTTLSNGLRVASEPRFGQFCTIGVVVDSGPRYEVAYPSGVSHFLEKLAFQSTQQFADKDTIQRELEKHGGICDCVCSRDTFVYAASADRRGMEAVTRVLAESVLRPKLQAQEVDYARQVVQFELESLNMRPEQEPILMDMIHAAAYRDNTIGLPKICPPANASLIDRNALLSYLRLHHTPTRMVVAGVGVDHDELVKHVEKFFANESATWEMEPVANNSVTEVDTSIAQYTGGIVKDECEIPIYAATGMPELAHIVIGLEGCSHQDPDFVPACVLNLMMGGGGSFSAGGPGKGMYARLYTNVLNRHHWMYSATTFNHAYADSGVFCIHASGPPENVRQMTEVITSELVAMGSAPPGDEELRRSKTQLQSMLLMNLEARPVVFEDIGRQVLATGARKSPEQFIAAIENVTAEDVQRVAKRFLQTPPSFAARGSIKQMPEYKDIQSGLLNSYGRWPNSGRLSIFR